MSEDTLSTHDYDYTNNGAGFLQEHLHGGSSLGQGSFLQDHVVHEEADNVDDLDVEIVEKELQLLITKRLTLQRLQTGLQTGLQGQPPTGR
jgi:hypothetical protein